MRRRGVPLQQADADGEHDLDGRAQHAEAHRQRTRASVAAQQRHPPEPGIAAARVVAEGRAETTACVTADDEATGRLLGAHEVVVKRARDAVQTFPPGTTDPRPVRSPRRSTLTADDCPRPATRRRSFVVAVRRTPDAGPRDEFIAHITDDNAETRELHLYGARLADPVLDIVSELLIEILREERDGD
jgi:hypothetical protein